MLWRTRRRRSAAVILGSGLMAESPISFMRHGCACNHQLIAHARRLTKSLVASPGVTLRQWRSLLARSLALADLLACSLAPSVGQVLFMHASDPQTWYTLFNLY